MGRFIECVQKDEVMGPLRQKFNRNKWNKAFDDLGNDEVDVDLYHVGLKIHAKSNSIRAALISTVRKDISATTKLRSLIAIVNHNFLTVVRKARASFDVAAQVNGLTLISDLTAIKIPLLIGDSFSPDEIIQSIVDAVQIPIKVILSNASSLAGSPKFATTDWEDFNIDFNLGQAYFSMEELWDDCLWNGFRPTPKGNQTTFSPTDDFWLRLRAASRARQDNLNLQFFVISEKYESHIGMRGGLGFRDIQHIKKIGRKQVIKLAPLNQPTQEGAHLASQFAYASEPFYKDLLNEEVSILASGTLNELLRAWAVIVLCANVFKTQLENMTFASDSDNPNSWLPTHAPVLQRDVLTRTIVDSVGISYQRASAFLDFLIYKGKEGQELWAQPLVLVGDNAVAPIFAVTSHPNLRRVVDVWLRQLKIDMGPRGLAFEQHLRGRIQSYINRSPLLSSARILSTGLKFRPPKDREEEIDLVIVVGDLVMLGEAKCSVSPTEAKQYARHRELVINATAQIQRKALAGR